MSKDIEKLLKIKSKINKNYFHLCIETNLEDTFRWVLFQNFVDFETYMSHDNKPILSSDVDSIEELEQYLSKHNGFMKRGCY